MRLPLFLDLRQKAVLLVGAGSVARDKFRILARTGAMIRIVARHAAEGFAEEAQAAGAELILRDVRVADLHGVHLLVAATNDPPLNAVLADVARRRNILVNAVDDPEHCDALFASQFHLGPLHAAFSSDGELPGLMRALRLALEALLPTDEHASLQDLVHLRTALKRLPDPDQRRRALQDLARGLRAAYLPDTP